MMPRKFDSEIYVAPNDEWIFRGNPIEKEEILTYFRNNLHGNEKGVYIENTFGELSEHGYLKIDGFPCHVLHIEVTPTEIVFITDDGRTYPFGEFEIYETEDGGILGVRAEEERIKYRFTWNAAKELSDLLTEEEGGTYLDWKGVRMEIPKYVGEVNVSLPTDYS
ncbi:Hypothetical protein LBF_2523 [Leptospira biflexa serovar Patoc strain 'Patoc 1 (Ames)']|jgi:hypothetical protein|uniref:DUF1285 domain-containing protein n=1 Tax=Leptospira biflexa serovar Patoc (strain Patoc 1 / ATCC 23582 / Paris) TaxID=456481 RepID=B0SM52_LEPBP|nr:hypothetical protein [Leptospira biflexa]ABZ95007.1 Hypothetical protein LBF_2523 [Leptospira biflexa serovar Patoc strain 'Patoc 1 (Ames)']ABZ98682.1 Conserved hypothetical protein [Leptospira biflexa serovar Patoc strain 'Patoc 1 (Paris)']